VEGSGELVPHWLYPHEKILIPIKWEGGYDSRAADVDILEKRK
jgi:hypothetical protein